MKWIKWIIGLGLICNASLASAEECKTDKSSCGCDSGFGYSFYADYLYWKVCRSDLDVGSPDHYVNPDYDHAFRVGGGISCDCWDLQIRYTSFETSDHLTHNGSTRTYDIDMDVVDIEIGYRMGFECADINLRPFIGAKLAWIDELWFGPSNSPHHSTEYDGYGLYLGAEGKWLVCCYEMCDSCIPISLVFRGSAAILDGEFDYSASINDPRENECLFSGVFELFVGLEFAYCDMGCMECIDSVALTVGYEAQVWSGWREIDSEDDIGSLGFAGAVVRFAVNF